MITRRLRRFAAPLLLGRSLLAAVPVVLAACASGSGDRAPLACRDDLDCAADSRCRSGSCVADIAPRARIDGPQAGVAHAELTFDASSSTDDDDEVVAYAWSVRTLSGGCQAEAGPTTGAQLHPLFPCPGQFEITLVVRDRTGVASQPATTVVSVAQEPATPPLVTVGADVVLAHRCEATPLACAPLAADGARTFQLSARGRDHLGSEAVSYRWEWIAPPAVTASGKPTVSFVSGDRGPTPVVAITTAGTAIAGEWLFVVTVTDAAGLSARETQSVVVQNRPPVVTGGQGVSVPHLYDAASARYRASGALAFQVEDPDGDPVAPAWRFLPSPDRCAFGLAPAAGSTTPGAATGSAVFDLSCAAAADLIGATQREIGLSVVDVNGAVADTSWSLSVTNRPPTLVAASPVLSLPHGVDVVAAPTAFVVQGTSPFRVVDPDGDPVSVTLTPQVDPSLAPHSTAWSLPDAGAGPGFTFTTPVGFPYELRPASGASPFALRADASDPWAAAAPLSVAVAVEDRPPLLVSAPATVTLPHLYDGAAYLASGAVAVLQDPDGDPLTIADAGGSALCAALALTRGPGGDTAQVTCRLPYAWTSGAQPPLGQLLAPQRAAFTVRDPWGSAVSGAVAVAVSDRAGTASLPAEPLTLDACQDGIVPTGQLLSASLPALVADPDGDPVALQWRTSCTGPGCPQLALATQVCWPGHGTCADTITVPDTASATDVQLDATDGVHRTTAWRVLDVVCVP